MAFDQSTKYRKSEIRWNTVMDGGCYVWPVSPFLSRIAQHFSAARLWNVVIICQLNSESDDDIDRGQREHPKIHLNDLMIIDQSSLNEENPINFKKKTSSFFFFLVISRKFISLQADKFHNLTVNEKKNNTHHFVNLDKLLVFLILHRHIHRRQFH